MLFSVMSISFDNLSFENAHTMTETWEAKRHKNIKAIIS